eukprot:bmy_17788T0
MMEQIASEEPRTPWGPGKSTLLPTRRRTTQRDINQYPSPSFSTYARNTLIEDLEWDNIHSHRETDEVAKEERINTLNLGSILDFYLICLNKADMLWCHVNKVVISKVQSHEVGT